MTADRRAHLADLGRFIQASPSSFHAAEEGARRLEAAGFARLDERDAWPAGAGRRFIVRDGALLAWIQPAGAHATTPFRVLGAHTDSPGFTLKPKPTIGSEGWLQAGVEVYGGPLLNSWLDRDLELAGRLVTRDGRRHLVRTGPLLRFPQLAVHLDRGVNTDGLRLDPQRHMSPILGTGSPADADVLGHLAGIAGVRADDVLGYDVGVADTQAPGSLGLDGELFAAGRMDNLSSVHAGLAALLELAAIADEDPDAPIAVLAAFDHEEVGSATPSGAAGPILEDVLGRISARLGASSEDRRRAFASSWCLSADAGHAVHPNYPDRHDPANRPVPNGGPLLKINANQRYATDGVGAREWALACERAGVPTQEFVSSNAVPCGSTIGPITATRLGIRTVDVGIPLLSMHSARELCGADDPGHLAAAAAAFLRPAA
ncbi:M18 family aminopeptidase [Clavibacter sp. VKM Ac-2872]|uniref:M18 family aminopeptidase n=1 Tax=Clavibacter sp. VKM Ac-2872 TaxID=2783812 RepID=UPI001889C922|nr:M18 family aminopeptidase [Clavibacter sp. VKM Ac-2872]MBF4625002.1 M18 family aminopeptidase [Clavibacter sp. VKM Ac-2872]